MDLQVKKTRTVKCWCKNNGVAIFRDEGGKTLYAIRAEYEMARMRKATAYLQEKYGDKFPEILNAYRNLHSVCEQYHSNGIKYKPRGKSEKIFLNKLDLLSFSK